MESLWTELLVAIITAIISVLLGWFKRSSYDTSIEDLYAKYAMVFQVSGELVRVLDEKLYNEMEDCVKKMTLAYQSPEFTVSMFNQIVKESADVFKRVDALIKNRS